MARGMPHRHTRHHAPTARQPSPVFRLPSALIIKYPATPGWFIRPFMTTSTSFGCCCPARREQASVENTTHRPSSSSTKHATSRTKSVRNFGCETRYGNGRGRHTHTRGKGAASPQNNTHRRHRCCLRPGLLNNIDEKSATELSSHVDFEGMKFGQLPPTFSDHRPCEVPTSTGRYAVQRKCYIVCVKSYSVCVA